VNEANDYARLFLILPRILHLKEELKVDRWTPDPS